MQQIKVVYRQKAQQNKLGITIQSVPCAPTQHETLQFAMMYGRFSKLESFFLHVMVVPEDWTLPRRLGRSQRFGTGGLYRHHQFNSVWYKSLPSSNLILIVWNSHLVEPMINGADLSNRRYIWSGYTFCDTKLKSVFLIHTPASSGRWDQ